MARYKKTFKNINTLFLPVLIFFIFVIFLPSVFVFKYFPGFKLFSNVIVITAIFNSFFIGMIVTFLNVVFGIPLAWIIARSKNKFVKLIDNLIDLSLVMPTAALGFSIYLYWGAGNGIWKLLGLENGLFDRGPALIILLHLVFTLPYMIRSVAAAIQQLESQHEEASLTLGASPFTFFRTVAMPLFKNGVINGAILSFTRSLSETGATIIVAGAFMTTPVLIINLKNSGNLPDAAGISIFLIITAVIILLIAKLFLGQRNLNIYPVYPRLEKSISHAAPLKNIIIFSFFIFIIFLPTIQIIFYSLNNFQIPPAMDQLFNSLVLSLWVAILATLINFIFSIPFSYIIARDVYKIGRVIDTLSEIVLLVPTSALGLSLALFWRQYISSDIIILLLAHMSFTFPLLIKPISTAISDVTPSQEEASRSLGAYTRKTFLSVLLPQIKPAIIAGCIMAFMRSLSETGATLAVSGNIKTVTILIVDQFGANKMTGAAFACTLLFLITFMLLLILKKTNNKKTL